MDASIVYAKNTVKMKYDIIPNDVVEIVKKDILDTLGITVAGSSVSGGIEVLELIQEWGGKEESTIIVFGQKVPSPYAALVNGTMAQSLDYGDAYETAMLHVGVVCIPAAFAAAERVGKVSGKDFITAVTSGAEMVCRLGEASKRNPEELGWIFTHLYGIFGAVIAAGKLLKLDEAQMVNALGIAYSQAAGNFQCIVDGALSKRLQAGFAANGGLVSALMASKGLTGARNSFEGEQGLFQVYNRGDYNPEILVADLGKRFLITNLSFKPYPCCRSVHTTIDAAVKLATDYDIIADDIEEIILHCGEAARPLCEPLEVKQKPRSFVDAQFSIPWGAATALVKRKFSMEDITPQAITNPVVLQVASKVKYEADMEMDNRGTTPARVELKMKNTNATYSRQEDIAKGHPAKPMLWDELCEKFRDCARHGAKPLAQDSVEKAINLIGNLEKVEDVRQVIQLLK